MRRIRWAVAVGVIAALCAGTIATAAKSGRSVVRDDRADSKRLKRKPELDIRKAKVVDEAPDQVKHKIRMQGKLKPRKKFTRPFVLINIRGGKRSDFEYLLLGPRVFKKTKSDRFRKVGANKFKTVGRTWIYRFKPSRIGLGPGDRYGWAVLTAKGRTVDLAPDRRYVKHRIKRFATGSPSG